MKIVILTKTNWNEAPRIRHQLANLLKSGNHIVHFFEKNTSIFSPLRKRTENDISFYSHPELIHHQLRIFPFIQQLNSKLVQKHLTAILNTIDYDLIINFHYDYSFLKSLTTKPIITFINDDFVAQGKFWMKKAIKNQLEQTCKNSDKVLTVSYPLEHQIKKINPNTDLFFPWAQKRYNKPSNTNRRNKVLYFGYINNRLDWKTIDYLLENTTYEFEFAGPVHGKLAKEQSSILTKKYSNIKFLGYCNLEELDTSEYFCSILPYNPAIQSVQACTISNRAFNLLSLGLPLAYADLKYLIESKGNIICKNKTAQDYLNILKYFHDEFYNLQKHIQLFLQDHESKNRLDQIHTIIQEVNIQN